MKEFFDHFFDTSSWPPRWHCGKWSEFHGWMYIISDLAIWAAYFTIPFLLLHFINRKKDIPFPKIFWLFGAFIFACGSTHLIDAIIFWLPVYRVSAFVRLITAMLSWFTIYALYKILPDAISLKTPAELEKVVTLRTDELRQSHNKMKFLADAMPQIVWTTNAEGYVDYYNEYALRYFGKTFDQLGRDQYMTIIHESDKEPTLVAWQKALDNAAAFEIESRLLSADGSYLWHLSRAVPHKDENGKVLLWVGTATEIETQKKVEEVLEGKVAERTDALSQANRELVQVNADLEQFAAIVSHDLKAPLRTVSMYLELLSDRNEFDEKSDAYVTKSIAATRRMNLLIENLLTLSRINFAADQNEVVDLNAVVDKVRENLNGPASQKTEITSDNLPSVHADETQMGQLFQNIIGNGLKYNTSPVPTVTIACTEHEEYYNFKITDNGVGIESNYLDKIFESFTRLRNDNTGSGLGLSITKRIIEKLGGAIWVESEVGTGTSFYFNIPKKPRY